MNKLMIVIFAIFLSSCMTTIKVEKPDGTKIYYSSPKEYGNISAKYGDLKFEIKEVTNDLAPEIVGQIVEKAIQAFMATQGTKALSGAGELFLKNKVLNKVK